MTPINNLRSAIIFVGILLVAVIVLGLAVQHGMFVGIDHQISAVLNFQAGVTPDWQIKLMQVISWFGGGTQRYIIVGILGLVMWRWLGRAQGIAMWVAALSSALVANLMKIAFARPRPQLVEHLDKVGNASYPSGHSTNAAVVYLLIALLVPARYRTIAFVIGGVLTFLTGLSRINLGVHWPTDVLGGWMLGSAFAIGAACWVYSTQRRSVSVA